MDNTQPQTQPQAAMTSPVSSVPPVSGGSSKKIGPIVAILIIVVILVIAAIYLFASRINKAPAPTSDTAMQTNSQDQAAVQSSVQPVTSKSDDVNDIQADLNASTNGLDEQNF
ncbi:MAG: hypothetical protein V4481_00275 [Patescibacteria group bacterium]